MEETVHRYCAAWTAHDVDALMAMQTDDMIFHLHLDDTRSGRCER